ncbi:MAG: tetratricopeptide repeat protein [Anaeromyxobacteraceae bacterium]
MSIVIHAFSVVVPVEVLDALWPGGEAGYRAVAPRRTYRCDGHLAGVAFPDPADVRRWVEERLAPRGLVHERDGRAVDLTVVDPEEGPLLDCAWITFRRMGSWGEARLAGAPDVPIAGPAGWSPAGEEPAPVEPGTAARMEFLGLEDAVAVLLDPRTGEHRRLAIPSPDAVHRLLAARLEVLHGRLIPSGASGACAPKEADVEAGRSLDEVAAEAWRMIDASPQVKSRALYVSGLALRMAGEHARAVPLWRAFTEREPGLAAGWMELTGCCTEAGRKDEALVAARKAVEVAPDEPGAWSNLGAALLAVGRRDEAMAWIGRAFRARPDDPVAWTLKRMAEGQAGRETR